MTTKSTKTKSATKNSAKHKTAKTNAATTGKKVLDFVDQARVDSATETHAVANPATTASRDATRDATSESLESVGETTMEITFTKSTKTRKNSNEFYTAEGHQGAVKFPKGWFPGGQGPASFAVAVHDGVFAEPKQPKRKLTKEERAALPKLTTAEKLARAEARLKALQAKQAREQASAMSPAGAM